MILYRLCRYFFFLFCAVLMILYFSRKTFAPFPTVKEAFFTFDKFYDNLGHIEADTISEEEIQKEFSQIIDEVLQNSTSSFQRFWEDEKTPIALEDILNKRFDDIEYLIQFHLITDESFKDLVVERNGILIYKHENVPMNFPLILKKSFFSNKGEMIVEGIYDMKSLYKEISALSYPLAVKNKFDFILSKGFSNRQFDQELLRINPETLENQFGVVSTNGKAILYYLKFQSNLVYPLTFFTTMKNEESSKNFVRPLFTMMIIIFFIILLILDRSILRFFSHRVLIKEKHKKFLSTHVEDKDYNWLNELAGQDLAEQKEKKKGR